MTALAGSGADRVPRLPRRGSGAGSRRASSSEPGTRAAPLSAIDVPGSMTHPRLDDTGGCSSPPCATRRVGRDRRASPPPRPYAWTRALCVLPCVLHQKREARMGIRTVRLDEETEKVLAEIVTATGLSVSGAMKKGLLVLRNDVAREARRIPYDVYKGGARPRAGWVCGRPGHPDASRSSCRHSPEAPPVILLDTGPVVALFIRRTPPTHGVGKSSRRSANRSSRRCQS